MISFRSVTDKTDWRRHDQRIKRDRRLVRGATEGPSRHAAPVDRDEPGLGGYRIGWGRRAGGGSQHQCAGGRPREPRAGLPAAMRGLSWSVQFAGGAAEPFGGGTPSGKTGAAIPTTAAPAATSNCPALGPAP